MIYPLPRLRVLCVDDHRDTADSTGILLELYGCAVSVCYDASTAFVSAFRFRPDLCLIDLNMPGAGGCELALRLRAWRQEPPPLLIAVTAFGSDAALRATRRAGFDMHLVKPIDWDALTDTLVDAERRIGRAGYISSRLESVVGSVRRVGKDRQA